MYQSFYTGALGAGGCMAKMSVIANNLANINNDGYKPKNAAFSDLLNYNLNDSEEAVTELMSGNGVRMQRTYTGFDVAAMAATNSDCDFAIAQENAFFMVQDPATGQITYTRSGSFHRGEREEGYYLTTATGKLVLDQNGEPLQAEVPDIEELRASMEEDYEPEEEDEEDEEEDEDAPRLALYTFANPSRLMSVGDNEYAPPEGMEPILVENPKIVSHALERSGTDLSKEMVKLIECQRAYSFALKMVTTSDEIESTINTLRG
ncbi:flagellar hook-basal body complex protein [Candidatus Ventrimonas sp. KK005]|nr:flagellar hook-basal body complex protein [Lachnospiraceae bacterium]NBH17132.1 flagellar hook-basal body complex protein [Clostridiaceae bacterium]